MVGSGMTTIATKVGGCELGNMVYDYALGRNGVIVDEQFTEYRENAPSLPINWEWLVLYDDGEMMGADTNDLQVIT